MILLEPGDVVATMRWHLCVTKAPGLILKAQQWFETLPQDRLDKKRDIELELFTEDFKPWALRPGEDGRLTIGGPAFFRRGDNNPYSVFERAVQLRLSQGTCGIYRPTPNGLVWRDVRARLQKEMVESLSIAIITVPLLGSS